MDFKIEKDLENKDTITKRMKEVKFKVEKLKHEKLKEEEPAKKAFKDIKSTQIDSLYHSIIPSKLHYRQLDADNGHKG